MPLEEVTSEHPVNDADAEETLEDQATTLDSAEVDAAEVPGTEKRPSAEEEGATAQSDKSNTDEKEMKKV